METPEEEEVAHVLMEAPLEVGEGAVESDRVKLNFTGVSVEVLQGRQRSIDFD